MPTALKRLRTIALVGAILTVPAAIWILVAAFATSFCWFCEASDEQNRAAGWLLACGLLIGAAAIPLVYAIARRRTRLALLSSAVQLLAAIVAVHWLRVADRLDVSFESQSHYMVPGVVVLVDVLAVVWAVRAASPRAETPACDT